MKKSALCLLWSARGKQGARNYIYAFDLFNKFEDKGKAYRCVFVSKSKKGKMCGVTFDNIQTENGKYLWEALKDYIENEGEKTTRLFYRVKSGFVSYSHPKKTLSLATFIYACYLGVSYESLPPIRPNNLNWIQSYRNGSLKSYDYTRKNLGVGHRYFPITRSNFQFIRYPERGIEIVGALSEDENGVNSRVYSWVTDYDRDFYHALLSIPSWEISRDSGALRAHINGKHIAFAEIVWLYFNNSLDISCLDYGKNTFLESVLKKHDEMAKMGIVIDHMTHNTANNFIRNLAAVYSKDNSALKNRHRVKEPYYFMTVYDRIIGKYKVSFGVHGTDYSIKLLFDVIDSEYLSLWKAFSHKAKLDYSNIDSHRPISLMEAKDLSDPVLMMENEEASQYESYFHYKRRMADSGKGSIEWVEDMPMV